MARPLRPLVSDGVYHVTARGNQKAAIYLDEIDRTTFLRVLAQVVGRLDWRCLTYCLMGNHFHLLVRTPQPNLDRGMQQLKSAYAQRFNVRHERTGHLFGGRYRAILIQKDRHLLEVFRYIALNPVRDDFCGDPAEWRWSAHAAIAGYAAAPPFLALDEARRWFGEKGREARYAEFVAQAPDLEYEPRGVVFGDEEFKRSVLPSERPSDEIAERDWSDGRPSLSALLSGADELCCIGTAYLTYGYPLSAIAQELGLHVSTVSRRLRRYEQEVLESKI